MIIGLGELGGAWNHVEDRCTYPTGCIGTFRGPVAMSCVGEVITRVGE